MGTAIGELLLKEEITLDFLQGRKVGIDSHNIIYQFLSSIRGADGTPLMDSRGNVTSHLTGLLYRTANLLERDVKPIFVFDGKPSELKAKTLQKRHETRTKAIEEHEKALREGRLEEARELGKRALKVTEQMIEDAKTLVQLMGLPVIQAPSEGEAQIAHMTEKGDIFGCISQDYDALLFGAPLVLRNVTTTGKRKVPGRDIYIDVSPEMIDLEKNLKHLNLDRRKLIWLGILIGTDFNEKFPKIGPKTALKLVQEHNSFEEIVKETKHKPNFDYHEIEDLFMKPKHIDNYKLEFKSPDREKILEFLCKQHDFSFERVGSALQKIEQKAAQKGEQARLSKWFG